jgi:hypothetical protein
MTERKNDDQCAVRTRPVITGQYGAQEASGKSVETVDQDPALFIGPETCGHAKTVERCVPREIEPADLIELA